MTIKLIQNPITSEVNMAMTNSNDEPQVGALLFLRDKEFTGNRDVSSCDTPGCDCSDQGTGSDSCVCEDA